MTVLTQLLLTNFAEDLPHLLLLLFCYLSRHFAGIDLMWSVRERCDCRESRVISEILQQTAERVEPLKHRPSLLSSPRRLQLPASQTSGKICTALTEADNFPLRVTAKLSGFKKSTLLSAGLHPNDRITPFPSPSTSPNQSHFLLAPLYTNKPNLWENCRRNIDQSSRWRISAYLSVRLLEISTLLFCFYLWSQLWSK